MQANTVQLLSVYPDRQTLLLDGPPQGPIVQNKPGCRVILLQWPPPCAFAPLPLLCSTATNGTAEAPLGAVHSTPQVIQINALPPDSGILILAVKCSNLNQHLFSNNYNKFGSSVWNQFVLSPIWLKSVDFSYKRHICSTGILFIQQNTREGQPGTSHISFNLFNIFWTSEIIMFLNLEVKLQASISYRNVFKYMGRAVKSKFIPTLQFLLPNQPTNSLTEKEIGTFGILLVK